ncbi:MAG: hypothetical protein M1820_000700 [Bogoriella megaspora]|nr:MAG: hypothetical protein M1820_000700 [Bogoriella megaspora]
MPTLTDLPSELLLQILDIITDPWLEAWPDGAMGIDGLKYCLRLNRFALLYVSPITRREVMGYISRKVTLLVDCGWSEEIVEEQECEAEIPEWKAETQGRKTKMQGHTTKTQDRKAEKYGHKTKTKDRKPKTQHQKAKVQEREAKTQVRKAETLLAFPALYQFPQAFPLSARRVRLCFHAKELNWQSADDPKWFLLTRPNIDCAQDIAQWFKDLPSVEVVGLHPSKRVLRLEDQGNSIKVLETALKGIFRHAKIEAKLRKANKPRKDGETVK